MKQQAVAWILPALGMSGDEKGARAISGYYDFDATTRQLANLRTYNQSADGTFGTNIPCREQDSGLTCCNVSLLGLRNGPGFRSSLACVPSVVMDGDVTFTVRIWDPVTDATGEKTFTGLGCYQVNDIFKAVALQGLVTDAAMATISWTAADHNLRLGPTPPSMTTAPRIWFSLSWASTSYRPSCNKPGSNPRAGRNRRATQYKRRMP